MPEVASLAYYGNVFEPVTTDNIGKGRRNLTQSQKQKIAPVIGDELIRQGYEPIRV